MGIDQVITMPIFFASNAIYPLEIMPAWLRILSRANPLTYAFDALRALMIQGSTSVFGIGTDFAVLDIGYAVLMILAARLYGPMGAQHAP
jgi:ABC-2 type transport system permease protein